MRTRWICSCMTAWMAVSAVGRAEDPYPYANETPAQRDARMQWWREARFGMFIHWGVYAVPAGTYKDKRIDGIGEWIMYRGQIPVAEYRQYARQFNPTAYDPDAWVRMAKDAGMKYLVITSKHHDGFALFDSKVSEWDVVDATPYGKDLLKPLAEACRKHGLKLGFYYSQAQDWTHPGGAAWDNKQWDPAQAGDYDAYLQNIAGPQVREILTNYGPLAVLWWDTPANMTRQRAEKLIPLIRLQPGIVTNDRLGGEFPGDFRTPEQHIPATGLDYDWETCMTMNDTWGYKSYDDNWKSSETLIRNLIDIASKGGNYLLNVGPTAEGRFPEPIVERLRAVGAWMKTNSESIYATTASPFRRLNWGRCTTKRGKDETTLYLHVFNWPASGKLLVPGLHNPVRTARLLQGGEALTFASDDAGVTLNLPADAPDPIATVIQLELAGPLQVDPITLHQEADGSVRLAADMADLHNPGYGAHMVLEGPADQPNIGYWVDARAWIEWAFRVDRPGAFEVFAVTATPTDAAKITVQIGEQTLQALVPATGEFGKYQRWLLGSLKLDQPGPQRLELHPVADGWKPINLRALEIVPAGSP